MRPGKVQVNRFRHLLAEFERTGKAGKLTEAIKFGLLTGVLSKREVELVCGAALAKVAAAEGKIGEAEAQEIQDVAGAEILGLN